MFGGYRTFCLLFLCLMCRNRPARPTLKVASGSNDQPHWFAVPCRVMVGRRRHHHENAERARRYFSLSRNARDADACGLIQSVRIASGSQGQFLQGSDEAHGFLHAPGAGAKPTRCGSRLTWSTSAFIFAAQTARMPLEIPSPRVSGKRRNMSS